MDFLSYSFPLLFQNKSPNTSSAFDDFDPFSGPLLSPSAVTKEETTEQKSAPADAFSFDDTFADTSKPADTASDPFGTDLLSGDNKADESVEESNMAANGEKSTLEAQFDDLMGDMGGVNGEVTRVESSSEVSSSQVGFSRSFSNFPSRFCQVFHILGFGGW